MLCVRKDDQARCRALPGSVDAKSALSSHVHTTAEPIDVLLPQVVIVADGQVTQGNQIVKPNVRKVRKIGDNVIGGFAGQACLARICDFYTVTATALSNMTLPCPTAQGPRPMRLRCLNG